MATSPQEACERQGSQSVEHLGWCVVGACLVQMSFLRTFKIRTVVRPSGSPLLRTGGKRSRASRLGAVMQNFAHGLEPGRELGWTLRVEEKA